MAKLKVYIAGPYTLGDVAANVQNAMWYWHALLADGFAPFCPHWSHFQHIYKSQPYEAWVAFDLEWLVCCDVLLRLHGKSAGAEAEEKFAREHDIPVFYDRLSLLDWAKVRTG